MGRITAGGSDGQGRRRAPSRRKGRGPVAEKSSARSAAGEGGPAAPPGQVAHAGPHHLRHGRGDRRSSTRWPRCCSGCATGTASASRPPGPVLLVANHVSVLDPLACARLVFDNGRLPHFLAKESVFKGFAGTLLRSAGQIPVARYTADAHGSLDAAKADLDAGNRRRHLPRGLGHPRSGLVADAGPHRGRPAGADHRRRRRPGGPVGAAAGARLPHEEAAPALPRAGRLPGRRAGRPLRPAGRGARPGAR